MILNVNPTSLYWPYLWNNMHTVTECLNSVFWSWRTKQQMLNMYGMYIEYVWSEFFLLFGMVQLPLRHSWSKRLMCDVTTKESCRTASSCSLFLCRFCGDKTWCLHHSRVMRCYHVKIPARCQNWNLLMTNVGNAPMFWAREFWIQVREWEIAVLQ